VNGTPTVFLCDSGACRTTVKQQIPGAGQGPVTVIVRSAQGHLKAVQEIQPVWLRDPEGLSCRLSVLTLPECPVNLIGRDALAMLCLALIPTDSGIVIKRMGKPINTMVI